jgi:cytidine deaminase
MKKPERLRLIEAALAARRHAFAPYSRFAVGAALLTTDGKVYTGANIESASFGLTCCAERVALFKALSEGEREFSAMAVIAPAKGGPMPCGACRQLLIEFATEAVLLLCDARRPQKVRKFTVDELLPDAFVEVPSLPRREIGRRQLDKQGPRKESNRPLTELIRQS